MSKITTDEYFGGCPECGNSDGYLNVGRNHWMTCDEHRTTWPIGANLFSSWHDETEADWQRNEAKLKTYRVVDPIYPEPTEAEKREQAKFEATMERARKIDRGYGVVWENGQPHAVSQNERFAPDEIPF